MVTRPILPPIVDSLHGSCSLLRRQHDPGEINHLIRHQQQRGNPESTLLLHELVILLALLEQLNPVRHPAEHRAGLIHGEVKPADGKVFVLIGQFRVVGLELELDEKQLRVRVRGRVAEVERADGRMAQKVDVGGMPGRGQDGGM